MQVNMNSTSNYDRTPDTQQNNSASNAGRTSEVKRDSGKGSTSGAEKDSSAIGSLISKGGSSAASLAKKFLGMRADNLIQSGQLGMTGRFGPASACADFVSAVMKKSGSLMANVRGMFDDTRGLFNTLKNNGWHETSIDQAKPGDPVFYRNGMYHTEMKVGTDDNGRSLMIGSDNINRDGTQSIAIQSGARSGIALTQG
ncbi:hypothetical protein [Paraburkholderia hayleyella]|uniref:hypothetical protein n=1 Tax=Paraburkholderia hayleyella TaxID=2152889 RepID=UPI00129245FC|nr:hypothetical protein [Paraburkholderia hayleyella]